MEQFQTNFWICNVKQMVWNQVPELAKFLGLSFLTEDLRWLTLVILMNM